MKRVFSNALRNDLQHPNEYIRGATLRFLCKIREAEVLEPLIASVRACLVKRKGSTQRIVTSDVLMLVMSNRNIDIPMCEKTLFLQLDLSIATLISYSLMLPKLSKPSWLL